MSKFIVVMSHHFSGDTAKHVEDEIREFAEKEGGLEEFVDAAMDVTFDSGAGSYPSAMIAAVVRSIENSTKGDVQAAVEFARSQPKFVEFAKKVLP